MGFDGANLWDLWGPMFLRCGTYGIRRGLWDCGVALMGHKLLDLWGPMGICWDLWGPMFLRCGTFGIRRGLWDCGVGLMGPMGTYGCL